MGSINKIWDPINWKVVLKGESKITKQDIIYKMIIGDGIDYQYYEIYKFISKENYENILNGKYQIKTFPYAEESVLLFDENRELIPLVKGTKHKYDELDEIQKEYVRLHSKKMILKRKRKNI